VGGVNVTHTYQLDKPYVLGRTSWPEAVEYNFRSGEHELRLLLKWPSLAASNAVSHGPCEFALVVEGPVILFLYQFGAAIAWSDVPYLWHLLPKEQRTLPDAESSEARALLQVILVDAGTGLVRALRVVTFSLAFTGVIHAAIRSQAEFPWIGPVGYDIALANIYRRYPTTADLLRHAIARTRGGP
jgi:hypothetical protein